MGVVSQYQNMMIDHFVPLQKSSQWFLNLIGQVKSNLAEMIAINAVKNETVHKNGWIH